MTKQELYEALETFVESDAGNRISAEDAIYPRIAGMKIYEAPLLGFANAEDPLFTGEFKKVGVIHPEYRAPLEWLPGAKTVISFFLPFTNEVKDSNRSLQDEPYEAGIKMQASAEWLHARVEGQLFTNRITDYLQKLLQDEGFQTIAPTTSSEFHLIEPYVSNWSERHAAYAAGLGTFGLSRGLITEKGMAGRFGSIITDAVFEPTPRPYSAPFEYCTMCGACAKRCPVGAIDPARGCALGKDQNICGPFLRGGKLPPHGPHGRKRHGCGKCQVCVPCENGIPGKRKM